MEHELQVSIPLLTEEQARIVFASLSPDPELRPQEFSKNLRVEGKNVIADFGGITERTLRVGVNSFMDSLLLALECLDELSPEAF